MNKEKLKEAIEFARENGLTSIEVDGIKMEVPLKVDGIKMEVPLKVEESIDDGKDIPQPTTPFDNLTDDEVLFWSTPTYDELRARKEEREQNIKNGEVMDD